MSPPAFDTAVPPNGYAWWYLDVLDPATDRALVIILLVGSVFSPGYARVRRRNPADPMDFCAVNIALYGRPRRWVMTEHPRDRVARTPDHLTIGGTTWAWEDGVLVVRFRERSAPFRTRVEGEVRLHPATTLGTTGFDLDAAGAHRWWPIAPVARAEVRLTRPQVQFEGIAYHDQNAGQGPLEAAFQGWTWSRSGDGMRTDVLYDVQPVAGPPRHLGRRFHADGHTEVIDPPTEIALPRGWWGVRRTTRGLPGQAVTLRRTLEDTPFYTRSQLAPHGVHEALDLVRFNRSWVRFLLPFRMRGGFRW